LLPITDTSRPWQVRIEYLRNALESECGERDLAYLYTLLSDAPPKGELPEHWYVIANDLMGQLAIRDSNEQRFATQMLDILHSTRQPLVMRDYAVQHLATWLNPEQQNAGIVNPARPAKDTGVPDIAASPVPAGAFRAPAISAQVLTALVQSATDPTLEQSSIPGTTLMMLIELSRIPSGVDCSEAITTLKPWLAQALQDGSTLSTPVRVSAVQAAGALAPQALRPAIRQIAYQENGQSSLRLPAIAALAHCGDADDLEKLQQIVKSHPELFHAVKAATSSLSSRLTQAYSQPLPK
jgi:hypothetical protein